MFYTLFEIIISALSVYGGYRLIRDISRLLDARRAARSQRERNQNE